MNSKPIKNKNKTARKPNALYAPGLSRQNGLLVGSQQRVRLRYGRSASLTGSTGAYNYHYFRGNSLFDPDQTGVGQQPVGFDQWSAFYTSYRVLGCKMTVKGSTVATTAPTQSYCMTIIPQITTTAVSSLEAAMANPICVWDIQAGLGGKIVSLTNNTTSAKVFGVDTETVRAEQAYSALVTSDPLNVWYWAIYVQALDGSSSVTVWLRVLLEYDIEFFGRKILSES